MTKRTPWEQVLSGLRISATLIGGFLVVVAIGTGFLRASQSTTRWTGTLLLIGVFAFLCLTAQTWHRWFPALLAYCAIRLFGGVLWYGFWFLLGPLAGNARLWTFVLLLALFASMSFLAFPFSTYRKLDGFESIALSSAVMTLVASLVLDPKVWLSIALVLLGSAYFHRRKPRRHDRAKLSL